MPSEQDPYAKGMVASGEHFDLTPELDLFQYRMIKPHLGKDILEIGAGSGRISLLLLRDDLSYHRFVINEPSDHFFAQLKKQVGTLPDAAILTQGETSDLKEQYPSTFDTIFSVDVLEHVEDDRRYVEDCLAMLKPGGKLIALVPALQFLYSDLDRKIGHYRRYDKTMVRRLINGLGCEIAQMYYTNFLAVFASLMVFKIGNLGYHRNESNQKRFIFLLKIYSKYVVPVMDTMERYIPIPIGLNLTVILEKSGAAPATAP